MNENELHDPHWTHLNPVHRRENDTKYQALLKTGILFRGWRFFPPFFCMCCCGPISTSQWIFARCHDTPEEGMASLGQPALAGRFLPEPIAEDGFIGQPVSVHTPEAKELMECAKGAIAMYRARQRRTTSLKPAPRRPPSRPARPLLQAK